MFKVWLDYFYTSLEASPTLQKILDKTPKRVGLEDRQDLLGHEAGRVTTHYSSAVVANLVKAANAVANLPRARCSA